MPPKSSFSDTESYYATLFHELVHWTCHESRLNRKEIIKKYGEAKAFEELVAELDSRYRLCTE
jgi:antirestriction protein ArdC